MSSDRRARLLLLVALVVCAVGVTAAITSHPHRLARVQLASAGRQRAPSHSTLTSTVLDTAMSSEAPPTSTGIDPPPSDQSSVTATTATILSTASAPDTT